MQGVNEIMPLGRIKEWVSTVDLFAGRSVKLLAGRRYEKTLIYEWGKYISN